MVVAVVGAVAPAPAPGVRVCQLVLCQDDGIAASSCATYVTWGPTSDTTACNTLPISKANRSRDTADHSPPRATQHVLSVRLASPVYRRRRCRCGHRPCSRRRDRSARSSHSRPAGGRLADLGTEGELHVLGSGRTARERASRGAREMETERQATSVNTQRNGRNRTVLLLLVFRPTLFGCPCCG